MRVKEGETASQSCSHKGRSLPGGCNEKEVPDHSNRGAIVGWDHGAIGGAATHLSEPYVTVKTAARRVRHGADRGSANFSGTSSRHPPGGLRWGLKEQSYFNQYGRKGLPAPR